jgi:hypothetical protein
MYDAPLSFHESVAHILSELLVRYNTHKMDSTMSTINTIFLGAISHWLDCVGRTIRVHMSFMRTSERVCVRHAP